MVSNWIKIAVVAILLGAVTAYFSQQMLQRPEVVVAAQPTVSTPAPPPPPSARTQILVAAKDMPAGTLLQPVNLVWRAWPRESADAAAYVLEGTAKPEDYAGSVVRAGVRSGEPMLKANIIKRGESGFLAAVLTPGMRAVSIRADAVSGVAGFVLPGDRVDIILSHDVIFGDNRVMHKVSETVLRNVRVIAVDQRAGDQEQVPTIGNVVTFEVAPEDAEKVTLAQRMGELRLVLNSLADQVGEQSEDAKMAAGSEPAEKKQTFTLDSDVSLVVAPPEGKNDNQGMLTGGSKVEVVRGGATSSTTTASMAPNGLAPDGTPIPTRVPPPGGL